MLDLINFNADASCLPRQEWMKCLTSGLFHNYIESYAESKQPYLIGITGLSLVDIYLNSPSTLTLLKKSPNIRHVVRPLVHSLPKCMSLNLRHINIVLGYAVLATLLGPALIEKAYLPPEFFFRVDEIPTLKSIGCEYIFHCTHRSTIAKGGSSAPNVYRLCSPDGSSVKSIELDTSLSRAYLSSLQLNLSFGRTHGILWRDGESPFLIPNGIERERVFISNSGPRITLEQYLSSLPQAPQLSLGYYPLSPLTPWIGDESNFWFYEIASSLRERYNSNNPISVLQTLLVLMSFSSDLVASAAKKDVSIRLMDVRNSNSVYPYTIYRDQRAPEAVLIDYLSNLLTVTDHDLPLISNDCFPGYTHLSDRIHFICSIFKSLQKCLSPAALSRGFSNIKTTSVPSMG